MFRDPHNQRCLLKMGRRKLFLSHRKSTAGAGDADGGCGARRSTFADDADGARGCTRAADARAEAAAPILRVQLVVCARWATVAEAADGARGAPSAFPKALPQPQRQSGPLLQRCMTSCNAAAPTGVRRPRRPSLLRTSYTSRPSALRPAKHHGLERRPPASITSRPPPSKPTPRKSARPALFPYLDLFCLDLDLVGRDVRRNFFPRSMKKQKNRALGIEFELRLISEINVFTHAPLAMSKRACFCLYAKRWNAWQ